jgi:hypothetical protein
MVSFIDSLVRTTERQFDDEPGGGFVEPGPLEGSDNFLELQYRGATGAGDYLTAVWNDPRYSPNPDANEESMRESFELTGVSRDVYDVIADYEGTWGGSTDSFDLPGPAAFGTDDSAMSMFRDNWRVIVGAVVLLAVLYLVRPLLTIIGEVIGE